jgi:hypothetical protein
MPVLLPDGMLDLIKARVARRKPIVDQSRAANGEHKRPPAPNPRDSVPAIVNRSFAQIVARQGELVAKQEKQSKATESRAKKAVARAKAARKEAGTVDQAALKTVRDFSRH